MLADTITMRDLYKKSHWQVAGPTFYQLHLLFDKHYGEQSELVDTIAERIQLLGGISIAMAPDVAETTRIERPPRGQGRGAGADFPVAWTRTKLSLDTAASWPSVPMSWAMTALTIWLSAMFSARMNCKSGSSANTWWICRLCMQNSRGYAASAN